MASRAAHAVSLIDVATSYTAIGWHVFPLVGKRPDGLITPRGQDDATTDPATIARWFARETNIGIACAPSGIIVIDVDPRNGGDVAFAALERELGALPATATSDTGGGGNHYVFRHPGGTLRGKVGDGIDLKVNGYIVAPPSVHPNGQRYAWREGRAPEDGIAELPAAWIAHARPKVTPIRTGMPIPIGDEERTRRARAYVATIPGAVSGDGGHNVTYNVACHLVRGFSLDDGTVRALLGEWNATCDPPWSDRELDHKIAEAKKSTRADGYLLTDTIPSREPEPRSAATSSVEPWDRTLIRKADGSPKRSYENVVQFVARHPMYAGKWALNLMGEQPEVAGVAVTSVQVHEIRAAGDRHLGWTPTVSDVEAAILAAATASPYHPVRRYLRGLTWDGVARIDTLARDLLGSDVPIHSEMLACYLIAAVARAMEPGCKVDSAIMLTGRHGYRKSSFFRILGGAWYADTMLDLANKDALIQIHGAWIYELAELDHLMGGRNGKRFTGWMTSADDAFRAPYAKVSTSHPRSVIFGGTTNADQFISDDAIGRRAWTIPITRIIDTGELERVRDQLWAEAVVAYESGRSWWLDALGEDARARANDAHHETDPWVDPIAAWLADPRLTETTTSQVLVEAVRLDIPRHDRIAQMRCGAVMRRLGWARQRVRRGMSRDWVYVRPES